VRLHQLVERVLRFAIPTGMLAAVATLRYSKLRHKRNDD